MLEAKIISTISIPLISALIGWFTNYIAVKMIFRPRKQFKFLGITVQGLLPKRQKELAHNVAETINEKLLSIHDVLAQLDSEAMKEKLTPLIGTTLDNLIQKKLSTLPMVGMFLQGEMLNKVRELLLTEMMIVIPKLVEEVGDSLESRINFKEIVRARIENFDLSVLEDIVYQISGKELRAIELLGGVLGFIIGLVQLLILNY